MSDNKKTKRKSPLRALGRNRIHPLNKQTVIFLTGLSVRTLFREMEEGRFPSPNKQRKWKRHAVARWQLTRPRLGRGKNIRSRND